jgi:hypothetical protein
MEGPKPACLSGLPQRKTGRCKHVHRSAAREESVAATGICAPIVALRARINLEEKIGQMTQAERDAVANNPSLIAQWRLGLGGRTYHPLFPHGRGLRTDRLGVAEEALVGSVIAGTAPAGWAKKLAENSE